ncbi:uncharacterized protein [Haliotis asinina]|uniref:uncharacterized protein n=1 Tax=Haliotis asinina TaxID=109174 RepID=UPI003531D796
MPPVYINICSEDELRLIPGIGMKLARKIVQLRETQGVLTEEDFRKLPSIRNPEEALRAISFAVDSPGIPDAGTWSRRMVEPQAPGQAAPSKSKAILGQYTPVTESAHCELSVTEPIVPKPTQISDAEAVKSNLKQLEQAETNLQARRRGLTPQSHSALYDQWQAASHEFSKEMEAFSDVLANLEASDPKDPVSGRFARAPMPHPSSVVHGMDVFWQGSRTKPCTEEIDPRVLQGAKGNVPQTYALTPGYRERRGTGQTKHMAPQPIPANLAQGINTRENPSTHGAATSRSHCPQPGRDDSLWHRMSKSREISDSESEEGDEYLFQRNRSDPVGPPTSSTPAGPREERYPEDWTEHGWSKYTDKYPVYQDPYDHSYGNHQCSRSQKSRIPVDIMDHQSREYYSRQCREDATYPVVRQENSCGGSQPRRGQYLKDDSRERQRMGNPLRKPYRHQAAWRESPDYSSDGDFDEVRPQDLVRRHRGDKPSTQLPRMLSYDGSTRWSSFYMKFQRFARSQSWKDEEKLDRLCYCLTGKAADFFTLLLERDEFISFQGMVRKLERRFGKQCHAETAQLQFPNLRQNSDESLEEWAERVLQVAIAAFPNLPDDFVEQQVVRRFCQGCANKEAAHYVSNLGLRTLESAMDAVQKYFQNTQAVYGRSVVRRDVKQSKLANDSEKEEYLESQMTFQSSHTPSQDKRQIPSQSERTSVLERLTHLEARVEEMSLDIRKLTALLSRRFRSPSSSPTRSGECFKCGRTGHFRKDCPSKEGRPGEKKVTFYTQEKEVKAIQDATEALNVSGSSLEA